MVALDFGKSPDDVRIADAKTEPPSRHVVGLGHGVELHSHVFRPRNLQETGSLIVIEGKVGIGHVVDHHDLIILGKPYNLFEEVQADSGRGGVVREVEGNDLGPGPDLSSDVFHIRHEFFFLT